MCVWHAHVYTYTFDTCINKMTMMVVVMEVLFIWYMVFCLYDLCSNLWLFCLIHLHFRNGHWHYISIFQCKKILVQLARTFAPYTQYALWVIWHWLNFWYIDGRMSMYPGLSLLNWKQHLCRHSSLYQLSNVVKFYLILISWCQI